MEIVSLRLLINKVQCPHCRDIIESKFRHDYVECTCRKTMTDGGMNYLRCSVDAIDLCVYDDGGHEKRREHLEWGTRGPRGDQSLKYVKIKDMSDEHLAAIKTDIGKGIPYKGFHIDVMMEEIEYRKNST